MTLWIFIPMRSVTALCCNAFQTAAALYFLQSHTAVSPCWDWEERIVITALLPVGRFLDAEAFPSLREFCSSHRALVLTERRALGTAPFVNFIASVAFLRLIRPSCYFRPLVHRSPFDTGIPEKPQKWRQHGRAYWTHFYLAYLLIVITSTRRYP